MSSPMVLMVALALLAAAIPAGLLVMGRLSLRRDFFFLALFFQILAYVHVAPTLAAGEVNPELRDAYVWLQLWAVLGFEIPLALLYCALMRGWSPRLTLGTGQGLSAGVFRGRQVVLSLVMTALPLVFLPIALTIGLFFRRIGHFTLALRSVELPYAMWAIYRIYPETALCIITVLAMAFLQAPRGGVRRFTFLAFVVNVLIYGGYVLVNNRLQSLLLVVMLFGVAAYWRRASARRVSLRALVALGLGATYVVQVVVNLRTAVVQGPVNAAVLDPFTAREEELDTPLRWRLNGVDLMAQIGFRAQAMGFALGRAWVEPTSLVVESLIDRESVREEKLEFRTSAKNYFLREYADSDEPDYFSCSLTDAYGNFGVFGFVLAAVVFAFLLARGTRWFVEPRSSLTLILGILLLGQGLAFEKELVSIPLNWLKFAPVILILVWLQPIRLGGAVPRVRVPSRATPSLSGTTGDRTDAPT